MRKLKVLHVVEALTGGIYSYFKDLSAVLEGEEMLETTIVYSEKREGIDPLKIRSKISSKIKLIVVPMERELSPRADFSSFLSLKKVLKEIKPDVLHLHSSKAGILGRAAHLFSGSKSKLYYTPHGYSFLRKDVSNTTLKMYYGIERTAQFFVPGTTIACGDTEYDFAKKIGPAKLVRNGVNIEELRAHYGAKPEYQHKLTVGVLGRAMPQKNPTLFNKVALENPHIRFLWIGDGELKKELSAPNIEITGWFISRSSGLKYLSEIDIYLQTSAWEGLPIALLEAMAFEKPIVATNIIGNKDVVIDGKTGFLCENLEDFNKALKELEESKNRLIMGKNSLERCKTYFDSNKNYKKLIEIYKEAFLIAST
ncbi:glycosyltransferase [Flavimarina sp. Hel_I_48]|uniref:glycosyltransferase n=1 Tax=Flavimarina sp. Hel_I_48 TaxID=1392488 RepID=UPI0004DF89A6|nr:glycosyltransferase [Flavimarina sp. Hel_I_48]